MKDDGEVERSVEEEDSKYSPRPATLSYQGWPQHVSSAR